MSTSAVQFRDESLRDQTSAADRKVHYLPFKVEHDGPAENVDTRFTNQIFTDKDSNVAQNYFRGRSMQGDSIVLKDYEGLVVTEEKVPKNSMEVDDGDGETGKNKTLMITSKFDKYKYWNWDMRPTAMDAPVKLNDWLELAQILHEPCSMDQEPFALGDSKPVPLISIE